jgi:hypothetical protein
MLVTLLLAWTGATNNHLPTLSDYSAGHIKATNLQGAQALRVQQHEARAALPDMDHAA